MKKAGSSNSKSKTRRTSKSTEVKDSQKDLKSTSLNPTLNPPDTALADALADAMEVGHRPLASLSVQDEALFRAFQSNLLSLISHELRTPLMGVMNALTVLEDGITAEGFSAEEWVRMARQNAQRLQRALVALLDLAALESGTFHARLREVDLVRLVQSRLPAYQASFKDRHLSCEFSTDSKDLVSGLLADAQKLGRAIDLCIEVIVPRAEPHSKIQLRISSDTSNTSKTSNSTQSESSSKFLEFHFQLSTGTERLWDSIWSQSLAGFESGVSSPYSAFAGVVQSEQAFLTRMEEGLGSEFLLIHEIARLHRGKLTAVRDHANVKLTLELSEVSSEEGLRAVLSSRAYELSTELGSVSLVLVHVPSSVSLDSILHDVRRNLLRSTDAVYPLPAKSRIALVLDDCKPDDAPRMMSRLSRTLGREFIFGMAHCPSDGLDPSQLLDIADERLTQKIEQK